MNHNYVRDDRFNILTAERKKGHLFFSSKSKDLLEVGDIVNYSFGGFGEACIVDRIIEHRDAKAYPEGNMMWYKYECSSKVLTKEEWKEFGVNLPEPPKEEKKSKHL